MFIFNSFSLGFSSFCHSVVFVSCIFCLKLLCLRNEALIQRGAKLNQMLKIFEDVFIMLKKVDDKTKFLKDKIL